MSENGGSVSGTEWAFQVGDVVKEEEGFTLSIEHADVERSKRKIKRRLRDESDGKRFYHVETGGGTQLYAAKAIESDHRVIENTDTERSDQA